MLANAQIAAIGSLGVQGRGKSDNVTKTVPFNHLPSPPDEQEAIIYTINDLLVERLQSIPNESLIGYPASERGCDDYIWYSITDLDKYTDSAARNLIRQGLPIFEVTSETRENKVVALLGPSDLDYVVTVFALSRMGYAVLFLSTRLANEAYLSLLHKANCCDIVYNATFEKSINGIRDHRPIRTFSIPKKEVYQQMSEPVSAPETGVAASKRCCFIVHSSGSTGLPKPIFQTHAACISNYANSNGYRAFLTLPMYHNHGISTFFRAIFKGKPIALHNANLALTGTNLLKAMLNVQPESFHGVPYGLKLLSEVPGGTEALARCEQVLFGGSSCPDDLGDTLVARGVSLISHYGATEMGQLMTSYRSDGDLAWNYVRPLANVRPYLWMAPQDDGSFECVVLDGLPAKVTSNSNDPPNSFRTSDTFLPHSTIPNAWKYLGRIDDRVTLVNGEKVLPIPIEHQVRKHDLVKDVVVFGIGKPVPGMMIMPSDKARGMSKTQILRQIWPNIEQANSNAERFSQITEEMIVIMDTETDYPATDKGTLIRAATYKKFADVIEAVYSNADKGGDNEKQALDLAGTTTFLLEVFKDFGIGEETDFYGAGVDSLQAIKARGQIMKKLDVGSTPLGQNVIYDYPNIKSLAQYLVSRGTQGDTGDGDGDAGDEVGVMEELISKYSTFHVPKPGKNVIMVTGTTGTLGSHILSQLLGRDDVQKIICPVRAASQEEAFDRVIGTLASKSLSLRNAAKILALPSDLGRADLGFPTAITNDLRGTLTKVIHSAWAVNFNLGVRSFEQQHITGVRNLINLCLSTHRAPAQFYFCSSISAAAGTPLPATVAEAAIPELGYAQKMGYARSKLVAERIVQAAAKTGMVSQVLRIGQIVGDTRTGSWNATEALPLMFQSAVALKALPALDETPSWLPADIVARSIVEICDKEHDPQVVYNIQNPRLFHWTGDLLPALRQAGLEFEVVGQREWIQRLREGEQDPTKNPTVKLVDFFAQKYDNDLPGRKALHFETSKAEDKAESLRGGFDIVGSGIVQKFVAHWRSVW